ncbi:MAG: ComEC/Rec2-related protein [Candidatus Wolfebacteria bacterium GW2011_GWE2_44_13]|uniref:ComEC/Rec2-related protein n=1 Tax=Candidatus Wolfebacteria bacterium GW2011_GWE2_44_13 TaxID=1619017 RepID=A0A0G1H723_9BACT|nr:MAG: ComEC/Rec2-related protein [Candidatus Wolfebacteria bacterium GW2011_GWE2_44_13]
MRIHESVFWGIVFFLVGTFLAPSMRLIGITILVGVFALALGLFAYRKKNKRMLWFAILATGTIFGAMYWTGFNVYQKNKIIELIGDKGAIEGHVKSVKRNEKSQQLIISIDAQNNGKVSVTARPYPVLRYGDAVRVNGIVKRPSEKEKMYALKNGVFATMQFPEVQILKQGDGNAIMMWLLGVKQKAVTTYGRLLPTKEAALLAGITLGERAEFSVEFKQQMANSGTTHLVALSGYNISVVAGAVLLICGLILRRRAAFYATLVVVVAFVVMAGAEASVVRAAIMGSIVLLAGYIGQAHSMRNAIAVSACAMVLWNPNVLRYDLGFQLSFLALLGIVYLKPHLDAIIKNKKAGILEWRENLSGTLSAQIMVFPILMHAIGSFSLVSLLSNIVILAFIPVTMGLGFAIAGLGFFASSLAFIPAWIVSLLLQYEIAVIELFGNYEGLSIPMNPIWIFVYYIMVGGILSYLQKRKKEVALCHSRGGGNPVQPSAEGGIK